MFLSTKISFIRGGESPCKNLYVWVARILIFLWCIVTELSFSSNFWKDDDLSCYAILSALSCIQFILLLMLRLWNIQINGRYPNYDSVKAFIVILFYQRSWCKMNKSIKLLTCFFTENIEIIIKFQVSDNCYFKKYLFCIWFNRRAINKYCTWVHNNLENVTLVFTSFHKVIIEPCEKRQWWCF